MTFIANAILVGFHKSIIYDTGASSASDYLRAAFFLDELVDRQVFALGQKWSLIAELAFYAMCFAIIPVLHRRPVLATYLILGMFVVYAFASSQNAHLSAILERRTIYIPIFLIGRAAYLYRHQRTTLDNALMLGLCSVLAFVVLSVGLVGRKFDFSDGDRSWTYPMALAIFFGLMALNPARIPRAFRFLGDVSYSLYLLHVAVGFMVLNFLVPVTGYTIAFTVAVSASLFASWLSFKYVERPSRAFARTLIIMRRVDPELTPRFIR